MSEWKESIFIWQGTFSITNSSIVDWKGTWVSTNDAINEFPSTDDFKSSKNDFILQSNDLTIDETNNTMKFSFNGYYLLDNGDGLEKYHDIKHSISCIKDNANKNLWYCYARGDTEFGEFISKGILLFNDSTTNSSDSSNSGILTLARRYVYSKKDTRLSIPIDIGARQMIDEQSSSSSSSLSLSNEPKPWENLPMKEPKKQKTQRKRGREE
jgi:hypothetical protein